MPTAGILINADLAFGSFAATGLKGLGLTPVTAASMAAYSDTFFSNSSDANNLYYRNHTGTNVRITNGATLDITLVGGIGGDYSAVGALLDFDDASDTYRLRQQVGAAVRQFAKQSSADLNLFEYKANPAAGVPANAVTLKSPAGLAGPYSITFPGALPGTTVIVQMTSTGAVIVGNTLANALTVPGFSHTDVWEYPVVLSPVASLTTNTAYDADHHSVDSTGVTWAFDTQVLQGLRAGDRIKSIIATITTGGGTVSYDIYKISGGTVSVLGIGGNLAAGTNTTNLAAAYTLIAGDLHLIHFNGTNNGARVAGVKLVLDHP